MSIIKRLVYKAVSVQIVFFAVLYITGLKPLYLMAQSNEIEFGQSEAIPLRNSLVMINAGGVNILASIGQDGILLADTNLEIYSEDIAEVIQKMFDEFDNGQSGSDMINAGVGGSETKSITSLLFNTKTTRDYKQNIKYIVNTSSLPDRNGGNRFFATIPEVISSQSPDEDATMIVGHENLLLRVSGAIEGADELPYEFWPSDVYYEAFTKLPWFNSESIQIFHMPKAVSDGDSVIYFRNSDMIFSGDIFRTDQFPIIHVDKGGSIGGVIEALNWIVDMSVPEYRAEGGTLIVPGHGRLSDISDVAYYRDMLTIIRDRILDQKSKGRTLDEIINSSPSFDYDSRYGRDKSSINQFIEAVYLTI